MKRAWLCVVLLIPLFALGKTDKDLKYGTILFDYYQQDYFAALVGYEYAKATNELQRNADEARILHGGMTLSYGLPDQAQSIFNDLLETQADEKTANKAWYYLAKLYYNKGEIDQAAKSLSRINGQIPQDITEEFNYLATLINIKNKHLDAVENSISTVAKNSAYEPYLLFNLAISQLRNDQIKDCQRNLKKVIAYADNHKAEEFSVLADRAKQALAHIEIQNDNLLNAWQHLQGVRTTGLYSNRALLSYGWTAIKLERYPLAVPALKALDKRSISIAEVQEAKVLLAHLYEQQGATRSALKQYLLAEKAFAGGVDSIAKARKVIEGQRIPEEFVVNLDAMMDETDWYGSEPSLDYNRLTPFLIELMSSNPFHSVIKELRDLYALRKNLNYWGRQAVEHQLIIQYRQQGLTSKGIENFVFKAQKQKEKLENEISDLRLHTMTLEVEEQERFSALMEATDESFMFLEDKLSKIKSIKEPYRQSEENVRWAKKLHKRIKQRLAETDTLIKKLEQVMRIVVNAELDNHEERMRYYWAQARLGKARIYDQTLNKIQDDRMTRTGEQP